MTIIEFIAWSGAIIFALTGLITLLSLIGIVKIESEYEKRLFYALIIEVIIVGISVFRDYSVNYSDSKNWDFVSITSPHFDLNQATDILKIDSAWNSLFVNGVVQFDSEKNYESRFILTKDSIIVFNETVALNNKGIFKLNIPRKYFTDGSEFDMKLQIIDKHKVIKEDMIRGVVYKP